MYVGIDYGRMNELSQLVQELSGVKVLPGRAFIGEDAYTIESGIVAGWYKNVYEKEPTILFPVRPEFVGHESPKIVMGKKSGLESIAIWSEKLGIELDEGQTMAVLMEVKLRSHDLKRVLTEKEFQKIAEKIKAEKKDNERWSGLIEAAFF